MKFSFLFLLMMTTFSVQGFAQDGGDELYHPYITAGGKMGSQRDLGETEAFLPIMQKEDSLLYGNLRWKDDSGPGWEANAGIGYRTIHQNDVILGAYVMGDQRETENHNRIRQITLGAEAMTDTHDLRINAYLPEGSKKLVASDSSSFKVGTQVFIEGADTFEQGAPGFDIEAGQKIPLSGIDLRLYVAGYHFKQPNADDMNGARLRLRAQTEDLNILDQDVQFQFNAEAQNDNIRNDSYLFGAKIIVPLGKTSKHSLSRLQTRMTEIPHRDIDIVVAKSRKEEAAQAATARIDGQTYTQVHELDVDADPNISAAVATLPDSALIRIISNTPQVISAAITLKDGQALIGSDRNLVIRGSASDRAALLPAETTSSHLIKATAIGAANPLIILPNGGSASLYDLVLTNEDASTGDANVMVSNLNNPVGTIRVKNISSDGAFIIDTSSGSSNISIDDSFIYGGVFRTRNAASMELSLVNNEFRRSFAVAEIFPQAITSSAFIEAMNTSTMHVTNISNNIFADEKAPAGGRASLGLGFLQSSSVAMMVDRLENNSITRTGAWDAGAILGQGVGGDLIFFNSFYGNSGDDFTAVSTRVNIGQNGAAASGAGFSAANGGMVYGDYGNNQVTNIVP